VREHGQVPAPAPLQLVLGEEEFLVERAVDQVVAQVRAADPTAEVRRVRAAELGPADLMECLSPSLFAEARVLVLQAAHEVGKELATAVVEQATDLVEGVVLVVVHSGGARNKALADALRKAGAEVTTCNKIGRFEERADFVRAEARRVGGKIAPAAVGVLIEAVGSDLRELASATGQLVADTGGTVDEQAVRRYHRGRAEASGFAVADKVVAGDRAGALEALRWAQLRGVPSVLIADALADALRTLAKVGSAGRGDPNRLAGTLGMPPWKIRKAQQQVRAWGPEALAVAYRAAAEVNADVKGAAADAGYALERAVLLICAARGRQ
jgi:DNA polymerase III subunit delta